jgi:hypothetical protein
LVKTSSFDFLLSLHNNSVVFSFVLFLRGNFRFVPTWILFAKLGFASLGRFIRPEDVPVQYGGLSRPSDLQNGPPKPASEFTVKGGEKVNIQIEGIEVPLLSLFSYFISGPFYFIGTNLNLLVKPFKAFESITDSLKTLTNF